ncbi:cation:proton antiporter [Paraliomyxa miuraensis]|uniref:hypothetical protein n=1 Tax=Paraliomyxa miuraensis TaxID=376150 RepID=UPI00224FFC6E|nr:hypothetical protein [Paraliomyxa miuraensis]MCX4241042.1 hypothetical protein [Paraliomyxa miuraensis]
MTFVVGLAGGRGFGQDTGTAPPSALLLVLSLLMMGPPPSGADGVEAEVEATTGEATTTGPPSTGTATTDEATSATTGGALTDEATTEGSTQTSAEDLGAALTDDGESSVGPSIDGETTGELPVAPPRSEDASSPVPVEPSIPPVAERPWVVIKTLIGLLLLVVLAYLGGQAWFRRIEEWLGISRVVAAGFPFLLLGLLARSDAVGILTDSVLAHLRPLLHLGLGWLGLTVGMRVELGRLSVLPRGTPTILGIGTGMPLLLVALASALALGADRLVLDMALVDPGLVRDALLLGAAGAVAADSDALRMGARRASAVVRERLTLLASMDEIVGLLVLAFVTVYFRSPGSWNVPGTAWLFITFGLSACVGFVIYVILRLPASGSERVALLLGSVAFTAGMASELQLSALVVCCTVGVLLANFPGDHAEPLRAILARLEAPIYLVFLVVAGALWQPWDPLGWVLMLVVLGARLLGRLVGERLVWRRIDAALPRQALRALVLSPLGTLPIAMVINAELLHPGSHGQSAIITAIIGGAMLSEVLVSLYWRFEPPPAEGEGPDA